MRLHRLEHQLAERVHVRVHICKLLLVGDDRLALRCQVRHNLLKRVARLLGLFLGRALEVFDHCGCEQGQGIGIVTLMLAARCQ